MLLSMVPQTASAILAVIGDPSTRPVHLFGIDFIGVTPANGRKLIITVIIIGVLLICSWLLRAVLSLFTRGHRSLSVIFWTRQAIAIIFGIAILLSVISIWFDNPERLATFMGFVTAGVAFALQTPISSVAGYFVIMRGKTFSVGDRITMGGVRGDVIALGFTQTTIMEMGKSVSGDDDDPSIWIHARQYTGRIVVVPNAKIFSEPVYNYTKDFPYIWEEIRMPISYKDDRHRAEQILLEVGHRHTVKMQELSEQTLREFERRYFTKASEIKPHVYWRLTDNWIEMTLRFIANSYGVRVTKDAMSRDIIQMFDESKIGIASGTYEIVGMPPLQVNVKPGA